MSGNEKTFGYGVSVVRESPAAPAKLVLDCRFAMFKENVQKFSEAFDAARKYMDLVDGVDLGDKNIQGKESK